MRHREAELRVAHRTRLGCTPCQYYLALLFASHFSRRRMRLPVVFLFVRSFEQSSSECALLILVN
jgi:hypothetical protein